MPLHEGSTYMDDLFFLVLALAFFVLSWGFIKLGEALEPKAAAARESTEPSAREPEASP
jgi:hypothetical protein